MNAIRIATAKPAGIGGIMGAACPTITNAIESARRPSSDGNRFRLGGVAVEVVSVVESAITGERNRLGFPF